MEVKYMFPIPRYLLKIFQADVAHCNEHNLEGTICCDCGCKQFGIVMFSEIDKDNIPHVCKYNNDYALVIKISCKDCKKEWLLFDMSQHGYNGYVCHDGVTVPNSELKQYNCHNCNENIFEIHVGIEVEDKEQFIEEVVEEEPDIFSEEDYVDAFDWINIDLKCMCCGNQVKSWINFETS